MTFNSKIMTDSNSVALKTCSIDLDFAVMKVNQTRISILRPRKPTGTMVMYGILRSNVDLWMCLITVLAENYTDFTADTLFLQVSKNYSVTSKSTCFIIPMSFWSFFISVFIWHTLFNYFLIILISDFLKVE